MVSRQRIYIFVFIRLVGFAVDGKSGRIYIYYYSMERIWCRVPGALCTFGIVIVVMLFEFSLGKNCWFLSSGAENAPNHRHTIIWRWIFCPHSPGFACVRTRFCVCVCAVFHWIFQRTIPNLYIKSDCRKKKVCLATHTFIFAFRPVSRSFEFRFF